jgi:hypothetical protein
LIEATVQFSLRWSRLSGLLGSAAVVPQSIAALAQGVVQSMFLQTIRVSAAVLLAVGAIGTVVVAQQGPGRATERAAPAAAITGHGQEETIKRENERILDAPAGPVTYVDYEAHEVLVSITTRMGARPKMKLSVLAADSRYDPMAKFKARIELTSVDDKESHARILSTDNPITPIRVGDTVHSRFWVPNRPTSLALVGKMDINRDGKDDREELKALIQDAGGTVDFDLPPPDIGKETGKLTPRLDWYVIDQRSPFLEAGKLAVGPALLEARFGEHLRAVVKEARLNGIRPMPIGKLLALLDQDPNAKPDEPKAPPGPGAKGGPIPRADANARIQQRLDMQAPADFPKVASLETVLKTIKRITTDDSYPGIPIYVDPVGLAELKVAMAAEIDVHGAQPIRKMLSDALRRLGLMFDVRDGFLMISSRTTILEHRVEEIDHKLDRVIEILGRLEQKN